MLIELKILIFEIIEAFIKKCLESPENVKSFDYVTVYVNQNSDKT